MQYEDRVAIGTPEGVEVVLVLAGLGSRFIAQLLDWLIKGAVLIALLVVLAVVSSNGPAATALAIVMIITFFCALFVYDIVFEVWGGGRTPGKRATGLRVVLAGGAPVTLTASAIRNLMRLIDLLPTVYLVGMISILATRSNQRLGDLAAGTIVVRERRGSLPGEAWTPARWVVEEARGWDVSGITEDEAATVARFIERRAQLPAESRDRISVQLAARLYPKVRGAPTNLRAEAFLERLLAAKRRRS